MYAVELPDIKFDSLNEADVRGEVIDPILRALGYQSGTEHNILRERQIELRYPHIFLGRKKLSDPVLRGRPDYICEVRGFARWILEAKPPEADITIDDIEQAHSYAVHAEIRAPLFVLCNGRAMVVFESVRGPDAPPLLTLSYEELQRQSYILSRILSPAAIKARYPVRPLDLGKPLAAGFGSRARITGGFTRYDEMETLLEGIPEGVPTPDGPDLSRLIGVEAAITGVACYRNEQGGIVADIKMPKMHELLRENSRALQLDVNRYVCRDEMLSQDAKSPSIFEFTAQGIIPAGMETMDVTRWEKMVTPVDVPFAVYAEATGYLDDHVFRGRYDGRMISRFQSPFVRLTQWLFMRGTYEVEIEAA